MMQRESCVFFWSIFIVQSTRTHKNFVGRFSDSPGTGYISLPYSMPGLDISSLETKNAGLVATLLCFSCDLIGYSNSRYPLLFTSEQKQNGFLQVFAQFVTKWNNCLGWLNVDDKWWIFTSTSVFSCTLFITRSTMTNEGFREYVNGNMLFWAANVNSTEGYKGTGLCIERIIIIIK